MTYPASPGGWPDPSTPQPDANAAAPPGTAPAYPPPPGYGAGGYPPPPPGYGGGGYPPPYPGYPPYGYPPPRTTNGMAIAALVCSLSGFLTFLSAPVGAILGHIARKQIRERGEEGDGMALAGIVIGWIITGLGILGCGAYILLIVWAFNATSTY